MSATPISEIQRLVRKDWGRILAGLTKTTGDLALSEDSLQDALESALIHWQKNGVPSSPPSWLYKVAYRKAIDRIRRSTLHKKKAILLSDLITQENRSYDPEELDRFPDKRLELIFTCCHPALSEKSKIALTLRTIAGLSTEDIAAAFLDNPKTMAQRLSRAKSKIKAAGIPYRLPNQKDLPERLHTVLSVIYLIFNAGYSAGSAQSDSRIELTEEALRLGRLVYLLLPDHPETGGLLALMLLHDSRREARLSNSGIYIPLQFQDRKLWNSEMIFEGDQILKTALAKKNVGPFQLQAAISGVHSHATNWETTDWAQIAALYHLLHQMQPTDVVKINHAVALSYSQSVTAGMAVLESISNRKDLENYPPFLLAKADFLERSGCIKESLPLLKQAIILTEGPAEKSFLDQKYAVLKSRA